MKEVRDFDEVYDEYMNKNKDYLQELLGGKSTFRKNAMKALIVSIIASALLYFLLYNAMEKELMDYPIMSVLLFFGICLIVIIFLVMIVHYYVLDNKCSEEIGRDVEDYYVRRIFTDVFPNYDYLNCHKESSLELKEKVKKFIGEQQIESIDGTIVNMNLEDTKIIEKVTTKINDVTITIMGVESRYKAGGEAFSTRYNTFVEGKLDKDIVGSLKVIYDEDNLPTGEDEFTDYYRVECDGMNKEALLTPGVKEAFVNARDEGRTLDFYLIDNNFIVDACPYNYINYSRKPINHWKINREWAMERYNVYMHIYNLIDELTR